VIAAVGPSLATTAGERIDARGLVALPGGVDPHVHFNDPPPPTPRTAGTIPPHSPKSTRRLGGQVRAPPLRPAAETDALWEALGDGRVSFVVSDHSPATRRTEPGTRSRPGADRCTPATG
jgi:dihydroorotase-like cyclic amidohydrolase